MLTVIDYRILRVMSRITCQICFNRHIYLGTVIPYPDLANSTHLLLQPPIILSEEAFEIEDNIFFYAVSCCKYTTTPKKRKMKGNFPLG